ncbi:MAG: hypothetical protein AAF485_19480, partial [Chloroflexota bacterium]
MKLNIGNNRPGSKGILDQLFRTAGIDGGLGKADPYNYSAVAIKMMWKEQFDKYGDTQFRKACERAAARELKRRNSTREPPNPNGAKNTQGPLDGVRATMATPPPAPTATPPPAGVATHNWDMITGNYETLDGEYAYITGQLPWATQQDQLNAFVADDGKAVVISKKASRKAMNPRSILDSFFGRGSHSDSAVHMVNLHRAIRDKKT